MIAVRSWHNDYYSGHSETFFFALSANGQQTEISRDQYDAFAGTKIRGGHDCGRTWGCDWCDLIGAHSDTPLEKIASEFLSRRAIPAPT